jgi:hypothetical protein
MKKKTINKNSNSNKQQQIVTKSQVRQMINSTQSNMVKYNDTLISSTGLGTGSIIASLNLPSTGVGESAMSGTSIACKEIDYSYCFQAGSSADVTSYVIRVLLVQAIGADSLAVNEVLQNVASNDRALVSPYRYDTVNKSFRVLSDDIVFIDPYNTIANRKRKVKTKVEMRYDSVGGGWATGQPFLITVIQGNSVASNLNQYADYRVWWYDI